MIVSARVILLAFNLEWPFPFDYIFQWVHKSIPIITLAITRCILLCQHDVTSLDQSRELSDFLWQAAGVKRLLFCGVGCQVQGVFLLTSHFSISIRDGLSYVAVVKVIIWIAALRSVEKYLGLEKLYVLGTNCGNFRCFSQTSRSSHFLLLSCMEDIM